MRFAIGRPTCLSLEEFAPRKHGFNQKLVNSVKIFEEYTLCPGLLGTPTSSTDSARFNTIANKCRHRQETICLKENDRVLTIGKCCTADFLTGDIFGGKKGGKINSFFRLWLESKDSTGKEGREER